MGARSGKLIISPTQKTTEDVATEPKTNAESETPCAADVPVVNGHGEEDIANINPTMASTDQVNGSLSPADTTDTETEKTPKKHKNPITWLQRRISKKNFSFNFGIKSPADKAAPASTELDEPAETEQPIEKVEDPIPGVADDLVNEVINSATTVSQSDQQPPQTDTQVIAEVVEESHPDIVECQEKAPEIPERIPSPVKEILIEESVVNGQHIEESVPVVDSNNTNGEYEHNEIPQTFETYHLHEDMVATKLANLELTNGHCEPVEVPTVNGCNSEAITEVYHEN